MDVKTLVLLTAAGTSYDKRPADYLTKGGSPVRRIQATTPAAQMSTL